LVFAAVLLIGIVLSPVLWFGTWALTANHGPPDFLRGQLFANDHRRPREVSEWLTDKLNRRFPIGTPEEELKAFFLAQRFEMEERPSFCISARGSLALYRSSECFDHVKILRYGWAVGPICGDSIAVEWSNDDDGRVTKLAATYRGSCL
jgi:hypothetical protein